MDHKKILLIEDTEYKLEKTKKFLSNIDGNAEIILAETVGEAIKMGYLGDPMKSVVIDPVEKQLHDENTRLRELLIQQQNQVLMLSCQKRQLEILLV